MMPLPQLQKAAADGLAFLRSQREIPPPVILSGHAALSRSAASSRRNLVWGWAVGHNGRPRWARHPASTTARGVTP